MHHVRSFLGKGLQRRHVEQLSSQGNRFLTSCCCQAWKTSCSAGKLGTPRWRTGVKVQGAQGSLDQPTPWTPVHGFTGGKPPSPPCCSEICDFNFDCSFWDASRKAGKIWSSHSAPSTQQTAVHLLRSQKKTFLLPLKGNPFSRPVGTTADNPPGWAIQLQSRNHQCFLGRSPDSAAWLCIQLRSGAYKHPCCYMHLLTFIHTSACRSALSLPQKSLDFEHEESHPQPSKTANALILQSFPRGYFHQKLSFAGYRSKSFRPRSQLRAPEKQEKVTDKRKPSRNSKRALRDEFR